MNKDENRLDNLPDLPALESVGTSTYGVLWVLSLHIGLAFLGTSVAVFGYLSYRDHLGTGAIVGVGIIVALCVWLLLRLLSGDFCFTTDARGLTIRGLLRTRCIRWIEVKQASTRTTFAGETLVRLVTNNGTVTVAPRSPDRRHSEDRIVASIWQHLRRHGKADGIELPLGALTFWDRIPDALPRAMDWTNPRPRKWRLIVAIGLVFFVVLPLAAIWHGMSEGNFVLPVLIGAMAPGLITLLRLFLRDALLPARKFVLREGYFEAETARETVYVAWSDVTAARWEKDHLSIIGGRPRKEVLLPYYSADDDAARLMLAVIRRLRTAGCPQAITIPDHLCRPVSAGSAHSVHHVVSSTEKAELRLALWERLVTAALVLLLSAPALIPCEGRPHLMAAVGLGLAALCTLVVFAAGAYVMRADHAGVTKRFLWWHKHVTWQQVAKYEVIPRRAPGLPKRLLRDANGKVLMDVSAGVGTKQDQKQFSAFIEAMTAEALGDAGAHKLWLARPWPDQGAT